MLLGTSFVLFNGTIAHADTTTDNTPVVAATSNSSSSASVSTADSEATVTTTSTVPTDTTVATSGSSTSLSSAVDNAKSAGVNVNETAASQYSGTSATSEAVADYASQAAAIDTTVADYQDAMTKYQGEQETYQEKLEQYNTAKSAYDEYQKEVAAGSGAGMVDQANNLIMTSEPNATVSISGVTDYVTPDAVKRLGIGGSEKAIIDQYDPSALTSSDLTSTDPYTNQQDHVLLMKVGDEITVTYDNLSNTAYNQDDGTTKKIAKIVYTYKLESSSNNDETALVTISRDPTVTITVGSNTETSNPISMDMGIKFYYEDGSQVDFSDGKAIVSLSSLNHWNGTQYLPNEKPQAITLQANDADGNAVQVQWEPYSGDEGPTQTDGRVNVVSESLQDLFDGKNVTLSDSNPAKLVIDGTATDDTSYIAKDANGNQYDTTGQTIGKYTLTNGTISYTPSFKYDQSDHVEKVSIGNNTFIYLPGSSITNQNGTVYSVNSNEYVAQGAKFNAESTGSEAAGTYIQGWDYPQSKTAYYGSGALILTDGNIQFSVSGNQIGQNNNTVMWFAMNATINTPKDPGEAPTAPVAPTTPTVEWHENQVVQTQQVTVTNVSRTINYTYENGPYAGEQAADSVVNNATFATVTDSATGQSTVYVLDGDKSQYDVNDEVKNTSDIVTALTNLGFKQADTTQFNQVDSPTIAGYTADKTSVESSTVNKDYGDQTIDVKYTIDTQKATINIIDETDNDKVLNTYNETGDSGSSINFTTADAQLVYYLAHGYEVSTDKTSDATPNGFMPADYDADSDQDQVFNVYLVHTYTNHDSDSPGNGYTTDDFNKTVTRTINYTYGNGPKQGETAAPTVTQDVDFTRNIVTDNVTGQEVQSGGGYTTTDWHVSGNTDKWAQVDSPAIASYTPSLTSVEEVTPTASTDNSTVNVVYTIGEQKATINIIDETDNDKVLNTYNETGEAGTAIDFNTADAQLKDYLANGYALSTDKTSDATANGFAAADYDADSDQDQVFNVYLVHTYTNITPNNPQTPGNPINPDNPNGPKWPAGTDENSLKKEVSQTIKYQYSDGSKAANDNVQSVTFTKNVVVDNVTGQIVDSGVINGETVNTTSFTPASGQFVDVTSPSITGYTPNKSVVEGSTVTPSSSSTTVVVTYDANPTPEPTPEPTPKNDDKITKTITDYQDHTVTTSWQDQDTISNTNTKSECTKLPQTGNDENNELTSLGIVGASVIGLLGLSVIGKKKKRN